MKEYYIVSNEHTEGLVRAFWKDEGRGYTINLEEAGLFILEEYNDEYPLVTKDDLRQMTQADDFMIHKDNLELLGKKMICILN